MATEISKRHTKDCRSRAGGRCNCDGAWQAAVYSKRDGRKIRKHFSNAAEAKTWRADALTALSQGTLRAATKATLRDTAEVWLRGAESGEVRNSSGHPYKPSTLRGYRQALEDRVLPELGAAKLSAVTTTDLQALVDRWQGEGVPASTIRNTIKPLQAIYRRAKSRGGLPVNPTHDLEMPAPRPREVEIVAPTVAAKLLAALPAQDRLVWATALYAGPALRRAAGAAVGRCRRSLAGGSRCASPGTRRRAPSRPRRRTSRRTVPMPGALRDLFVERRLAGVPGDDELVFGPFRRHRSSTAAPTGRGSGRA